VRGERGRRGEESGKEKTGWERNAGMHAASKKKKRGKIRTEREDEGESKGATNFLIEVTQGKKKKNNGKKKVEIDELGKQIKPTKKESKAPRRV